jgi:hypothetical protein
MLLSPDDARLFFKLMPALQFFGNQRLNVIKNLKDVEQYRKISDEQRLKLRDAVYKKPEIIDAFVKENPFGFSQDDLEIVAGWKNFIVGDFFIERILKKYAIFIYDDKVYGVLGLVEPLDYVLDGRPLPVYVKTVLLPFKGRIIYDGLMQSYSVYFGGGISGTAANQYRAAKMKGTIIESLDPGWKPAQAKPRLEKDWRPVLNELTEKASKLKASKDDPAIHAPAFKLLQATLTFVRTAIENPDDMDKLDQAIHKVALAHNKIGDILELMDY